MPQNLFLWRGQMRKSTQPQRMKRLGELLSGDLTHSEQEEFMTLGIEFLCALAVDLNITDCTVTGTRATIATYSGQIRLEGQDKNGHELVVDLEQNFLTFQEEQTCLYCRPKATGSINYSDCRAVGVPLLLNGDYDKLLAILRATCGGGDADGRNAA